MFGVKGMSRVLRFLWASAVSDGSGSELLVDCRLRWGTQAAAMAINGSLLQHPYVRLASSGLDRYVMSVSRTWSFLMIGLCS